MDDRTGFAHAIFALDGYLMRTRYDPPLRPEGIACTVLEIFIRLTHSRAGEPTTADKQLWPAG